MLTKTPEKLGKDSFKLKHQPQPKWESTVEFLTSSKDLSKNHTFCNPDCAGDGCLRKRGSGEEDSFVAGDGGASIWLEIQNGRNSRFKENELTR